MEVKIDTKEKFTVVTPIQHELSANIAAEIENTCTACLQNDVKNLILNLERVTFVGEKTAEMIAALQQRFYKQNASFVVCCMLPDLEEIFERLALLEQMNVTPTESEAWDIVQMEEIERELLDGDDTRLDTHA
ncbi:MAG: hypothetical protein NVSMB63_10390 [Sediminibacterium sp.]